MNFQKLENPSIVVAPVAVLAIFEIWKSYERNAPTLAQLRSADKDDIKMKQQMLDADLTIGTIALAVGAVFTVQTKDPSLIILIVIVLGALSLWRHNILSADPR